MHGSAHPFLPLIHRPFPQRLLCFRHYAYTAARRPFKNGPAYLKPLHTGSLKYLDVFCSITLLPQIRKTCILTLNQVAPQWSADIHLGCHQTPDPKLLNRKQDRARPRKQVGDLEEAQLRKTERLRSDGDRAKGDTPSWRQQEAVQHGQMDQSVRAL